MFSKYKLFNVLRWIWNIDKGAELPSVYFMTNSKNCITYLALTQRFPVFMTSWFHIVKNTTYVAFCFISLRSLSFPFSYGCVQMGQTDFISNIFGSSLFKMILESMNTDHTSHMYRLISPL